MDAHARRGDSARPAREIADRLVGRAVVELTDLATPAAGERTHHREHVGVSVPVDRREEVEQAVDLDPHDRLGVVVGLGREPGRGVETGVVHDHGEAARQLRDQRVDVACVGDVALPVFDTGAGRTSPLQVGDDLALAGDGL